MHQAQPGGAVFAVVLVWLLSTPVLDLLCWSSTVSSADCCSSWVTRARPSNVIINITELIKLEP